MKLRLAIIIFLAIIVSSSQAYANTIECNYNWQDVEAELNKKYPYNSYEYLDESGGNLYFIRKDYSKSHIQNINKKSGNVYELVLDTTKWEYQGHLSVTDCTYKSWNWF